jgi:GT2 family glycosyltransferase
MSQGFKRLKINNHMKGAIPSVPEKAGFFAKKIMNFKTRLTTLSFVKIKRAWKYLLKNGPSAFVHRFFGGEHIEFGIPYEEWLDKHKVTPEELERQKNHRFKYEPTISLIVPTYQTPLEYLHQMIDSVMAQSYSNWELCIAEGSGGNKELEAVINNYARNDSRIKHKILEGNQGIAGNSNEALSLATGEYIALFDHDDILTPDALFEVVQSVQDTRHDIIYTDEDKVNSDLTEYKDPNFKPDWSPNLFCSHNYITHLFVVKKSILDKVGGFREEFEGSQDYDLMFRCLEEAKDIKHIPRILYHWRVHDNSVAGDPESKMYAYEAGRKAIEAHYKRTGVEATVETMELWGMYHTIYGTPNNPLVSIIIPNKDHVNDLKVCLKSLFKRNSYQNFEVIIVENNSVNKKTFDYYKKLQEKYKNVKVVVWSDEFNYSAINNFGVQHAKGDHLLFLNNDTKVINPTAISELLGCCMQDKVGIAGAKLLFKDNTVQHGGVVIGFGGFAGHVFTGIHKNSFGYMVRARINCNYSAVTAACMMVKRTVFEEVEGFNEAFKVGLNDIDFCLKVRETGKLVAFNAHSLWYHYESKSRGYEDTQKKQERFQREINLFQERWSEILRDGDPYYNKNFVVELGPYKLGHQEVGR